MKIKNNIIRKEQMVNIISFLDCRLFKNKIDSNPKTSNTAPAPSSSPINPDTLELTLKFLSSSEDISVGKLKSKMF